MRKSIAPMTLRLGAGVLAALCVIGAVQAQTFPNRQLTITVPYAAGGPTDQIARILAERMGRSMGQTIIIDTAVGGGGTLAGDKVVKAAPDGYTLLIQHLALLAQNKLYPSVRYDARTALVPVGLVNSGPMVLVARKSIPAKNAAELFAWIKANGEKTTVGHAGLGTNSHLCEVLLSQALGTKLTYVTYRGAAPALNDLMSGQIDVLCDQSTNSVPQILAGTVNAFAVTTPERSAALPNVPTVAEVGVPDVLFSVWHGIYAPKYTPPDIIAKLNAEISAAVDDPDVLVKFALVGTVPYPKEQRTVAAHAALFARDYERLNKLIDDAGITPEAVK